MPKKNFKDLNEREILALAIQLEEEDSRVYADFAEGLNETYPATAKVFREMQAEESRHRQSLIDTYQQRFGDHIPLIRRQDVKGFVERRPIWLVRPLGINAVRKQVEVMELETSDFTSGRSNVFPNRRPASSWAIWQKSNGSTTISRKHSKKNILDRNPSLKRKSRAVSCSCCKSSSQAWPG